MPDDRTLKTTAKSPFPSTTLWPETDTTDKCDKEQALQYSQLIGFLRWAVELGRIDMYTEVSLLSQHLALPRVGHLEVVYHVFLYLNKQEKPCIIYDPTDPVPITPTQAKPDWSSFYNNLKEEFTASDAGTTWKCGKYPCLC